VCNIEDLAEVAADMEILANGLKLFPLIKKKFLPLKKTVLF